MRSLFVTRWRPHRPDGGAQLRNAQNIAALAGLGDVDVLSIGREETLEPVAGIGVWRHVRRCPTGAALLRPGYHPLVDPYRTPEAARCLEGLLARGYDLAVIEEISLARHVAPLRAAGIRVVFDAHNVEAQLRADLGAGAAASWLARLRRRVLSRRLARIERDAVAAADLVWACSAVDA
jgi:hypothetical protein